MLKKQTTILTVLCAMFVLLIVAYFAVVKPMVEREEPIETEPPETLRENEAEAMGNTGKVLVITMWKVSRYSR